MTFLKTFVIIYIIQYVIQRIVLRNTIKGAENMSEELKVRSFRISDEISEKFKLLCGDFENQNTALSALINAYEMNSAKNILVERQTEIKDYDVHIQAIQKAFLSSLELNQNAENRIRAEFENRITAKDDIIEKLNSQINEANLKVKDAENRADEATKNAQTVIEQSKHDIDALNERVKQAEKSEQQAQDTLSTLKEANYLLRQNNEELQTLKKEIKDLQEKNKQLEEEKINEYESQKEEQQANYKKIIELQEVINKLTNEIADLKISAVSIKNEENDEKCTMDTTQEANSKK